MNCPECSTELTDIGSQKWYCEQCSNTYEEIEGKLYLVSPEPKMPDPEPYPDGCKDRQPTRTEPGQACIISRAVRQRMWKIAVDQLKDEGLIPPDLPWL